MKQVRATVSAMTLLLVAFILVVGGCGKSASVSLGPKPTVSSWQTSTQDSLRTWLETMNSQDASTLDKTGRISYSYSTLKASDPTHASVLDKYAADWKAKGAQSVQDAAAKGRQMPPTMVAALTSPGTPDTVEFCKEAPGAYYVKIRFTGGTGTTIRLSDKQ